MPPEQPRWAWMGLGLGLATAATLILEIALTRIFSVILWYHYGFMTISLALLGLGLAGVVVYLYPERFPKERAAQQTATAALLFGATTAGSILVFHWIVSVGSHWPLGAGYRSLMFVTTLVPFFFAGLTVAIPISRYTERIGGLYAADLVGAGAGALLAVPLIGALGGYPVTFACAGLACLAALCFARAVGRARASALAVVAAQLCFFAVPLSIKTDLFRIRYVKSESEPPAIAERWNSFSRVTVHEADRLLGGWNIGLGAPQERPDFRRIVIDAHASTQMIAFHGDLGSLEHLRYDVSSLGYQVRSQSSVVIIGAGGGRDILTARLFDVPEIHAVEINPLVVDFVRGEFRDFSGSPYDLPGVTASVMDGRSFVAQAGQRFDHIQLSAVDTTAALAAGALSLVENSLYTVEAFEDYYDHLSETGLVSITRNWSEETQMMALRTTDLVRAAWAGRGQPDPRQHIVIIAPRDTRSRWGTLLASRPPFTAGEVERIRARADELGFAILYAPGAPDNPRAFDELLGSRRAELLRDYPYDVAATTDDKPFFFFFEKPFSFGRSGTARESEQVEWAAKATPRVLQQAFVLVVSLVAVLAFVVPMLLGRLRLPAARGAGTGLLYFAAIGLGFIMVEIALIQRYGLLLGQPLWALSGVLGTILVFSGLGSLVTRSVSDERVPRALLAIVGVILALVLIHAVVAPPVLHAAMSWSLPLRVLIMLASLAPVGFVMGMPLPLGMRLMERSAPRALAWAWGVNGSLSVMGTVLAMFVSVFFGITSTMAVGGMLYLLTLPLIRRGAGSVSG